MRRFLNAMVALGDTAERAQFRENMRGSLCRKKPLDLRRIKEIHRPLLKNRWMIWYP